MSLSEVQIRAIVKDELRKILDAGLMYSTETAPQAPKQEQVKLPAQLANEHTEKEKATSNPEVCPKCGGKKKPQYDVCWKCHEATK